MTLRPLEPGDAPRIAEIGAAPEVARWWPDLDEAAVHKMLAEAGLDVFAIEYDGLVIGLVQAGEEPDPEYRHASVDISLAPAWHGQGLGSDAVRTLARWLFTERGHHRLTIDPDAANERAIRSYERVGFKRVGVMRRYWRGDGDWRDGVLLDLLRDELR